MASAGIAGDIAANVMGGTIGKAIPIVGTVAGVGMDYMAAENERADINKYFGRNTLRQAIRQNPALGRKLKDLDERWQTSALGSAASIVGGAVAGALLGSFIPVVGFIIGSIAGGFGGNYLYNKAFVEQAQDPVVINMQIGKMREAGEYVPPEVVFAALAANLSDKNGKTTDGLLKKYTGTKLFTEALADPNNMPKLTALMNNTIIDDAIRAQTGMPRDQQNPFKTVAEQYAELINSGQMDVKNMLNRGEGIYALSAVMNRRQTTVDVPVTPETGRHSLAR